VTKGCDAEKDRCDSKEEEGMLMMDATISEEDGGSGWRIKASGGSDSQDDSEWGQVDQLAVDEEGRQTFQVGKAVCR